jgi:hypothetical protein
VSEIVIATFAERPEYVDRAYEFENSWPAFVLEGLVADAHFLRVLPTFPELAVVATDEGAPVARAVAIPFALHTRARGGTLPDGGWDRVLLWGMADHFRGTTPDTCSALEVTIAVTHQGRGLSHRMLAALRDAVGRQGFETLVAPVRPNRKHLEPHVPMDEYAARVGAEGLPEDPWLRVHARAGATIEKVAPTSMTVVGTLPQWRDWTGQPFEGSGPVEVPGALVPVHVDARHGHAVYVEPNVWMRHNL